MKYRLVRIYIILKACEKSGSQMPSLLTEIVSGEWDMILVWNIKEGIEEMNWQVSPNDVKWMKGINEITGGVSQTKQLWMSFLL